MNEAKRLLVVDDDEDFADSLADLLRAEGFQVEVAYSGAAAVGLTREQSFDVTLVDMQMPGEGGVDSLRRILDLRPSARVVMMTGYSIPALLDQAVASGASGVMRKPLDLARLRALLDGGAMPPLVLVAEDDEDLADSLRAMLEQAGYTVMAAASGLKAVEWATARRPDVLLLDLRMPGMGGIEAWHELARRGVCPPTIVLSAFVDEERDALRTLETVPDERVVRKPVEPGHLLRLVERAASGC